MTHTELTGALNGACAPLRPLAAQARVAAVAAAAALLALGCGTNGDATSDGLERRCAECHPSAALAGAHARHLGAGLVAGGFECTECHADRTRHHGGVPLTVAFGALADATDRTLDPALAASRAGTLSAAAYDRTDGTCSNVYCHGATIDGSAGEGRTPPWSSTGSVSGCSACHGDPPSLGGFHTTAEYRTCTFCHSGTLDEPGLSRHVNGVADYDAERRLHPTFWVPANHPGAIDHASCTPCHGYQSACDTCRACHNSGYACGGG